MVMSYTKVKKQPLTNPKSSILYTTCSLDKVQPNFLKTQLDPGSYIHKHTAIKDITRTVITGKFLNMNSVLDGITA